MNVKVITDELETILNQKQSMAMQLCKILMEHFLFDKKPTEPEEIAALQCNYSAIQYLVSAIFDYEKETAVKLEELVLKMNLM